MRMQIINLALQNNIKVYECSILPQNLLSADEVFFTNAIRGINWVGGYFLSYKFTWTSLPLTMFLFMALLVCRLWVAWAVVSQLRLSCGSNWA